MTRPDTLAAIEEERDGAYRERNALVAALIRLGGYRAEVVMAPDTEGWWIVYAETPAGQVSWHIAPDDMDLFSEWRPVAFGSHHSPWDGHTTEEKYRRLALLRSEAGGEGLREAAQWLVDIHADSIAIEHGSALWEDIDRLRSALSPSPDRRLGYHEYLVRQTTGRASEGER